MLLENEYYCVGDEKEIRDYNRKLYFENNDLEIKGKYNVLLQKYKNIVNNVLYELPDGDFFGFNLKRFLEGYKKATPSISQLMISRDMAKYMNQIFDTDEFDINKQIDFAKASGRLKEGGSKSGIELYVSYLCECFLTEDDLLKKGIGKMSIIKNEWYNRFIADVKNSSFGKLLASEIGCTWSMFQCIKNYEKYLCDKNELKEDESILEEKWAVMTYSGAYQLLKKDITRKSEKIAIDRLINELYIRQMLDGEMPTFENHI